MIRLLVCLTMLLMLPLSTATAQEAEPAPAAMSAPFWQPAPGTTWQIQLMGTINTSYEVEMYDIDLFDSPQEVIDGLHERRITVICYFSAGTFEDWRPDAGDFPQTVI